jgi:hypothetical protein
LAVDTDALGVQKQPAAVVFFLTDRADRDLALAVAGVADHVFDLAGPAALAARLRVHDALAALKVSSASRSISHRARLEPSGAMLVAGSFNRVGPVPLRHQTSTAW